MNNVGMGEFSAHRLRHPDAKLPPKLNLPAGLRLSETRAALLTEMYRSSLMSRDSAVELMEAINGREIEWPEKTLGMQIYCLRRLLKPYGVQINVVWGEGYALPPASRAILAGWQA